MQPVLSVSELVEVINNTLEATLPQVVVEGEVAGYKEWNSRLAFFDLKDEDSVINCMIPLGRISSPIEDGMRIKVYADLKLTKKGRFSLNVVRLEPVGEGAIKKAFELLKSKLEKEGLLADERKRPTPEYPGRVGVITSLESAAYQDFLKIINARWVGMEVLSYHVQVQGDVAEDQIIKAIDYFNQMASPVDILVLIRGGGSQEDLLVFNSELVARAVAGSRSATVVGIGHEVDISLAELVADIRAATPTDAARLITPDKDHLVAKLEEIDKTLAKSSLNLIASLKDQLDNYLEILESKQQRLLGDLLDKLESMAKRLMSMNPEVILRRGYAILRKEDMIIRSIGEISVGDKLMLQLSAGSVETEVLNVKKH
ncbi:MAG: exodeoxyribonuclease VII large subunit [Candidatus Saccharimonadales bacterium]